jgi:hypothetical protein
MEDILETIVPDVLESLFAEFLQTLDDEDCFDCIDTERNNASSVLMEFLDWVKSQKDSK